LLVTKKVAYSALGIFRQKRNLERHKTHQGWK